MQSNQNINRMNTKKFIIGTVAGGIAFFILGFLIYAVLLSGFFASNAGSASGVQKEQMDWWALVLGNMSFAALLSYIFLKWAHISTFGGGLRAGAIIGLFTNLGWDLVMYGTSNLMNLSATLVDVIAWTVVVALVGGIIGAILHTKPQGEPATA